jgi:hypothetical protein
VEETGGAAAKGSVVFAMYSIFLLIFSPFKKRIDAQHFLRIALLATHPLSLCFLPGHYPIITFL